jgi:hypothetical protein
MKTISLLESVDKRKKAVAWALRFAKNTSLEPGPYEQELLARFVEGGLTLDEVQEQLESSLPAIK